MELRRPDIPDTYTISFDWTFDILTTLPYFGFGYTVQGAAGSTGEHLAGTTTSGTFSGTVTGVLVEPGDDLYFIVGHDYSVGQIPDVNMGIATITNFTFSPPVPAPGAGLLLLAGVACMLGARTVRPRDR